MTQATYEGVPANARADNKKYKYGSPPQDLPKLAPAPVTRVAGAHGISLETIDLTNRHQRSRFLDVAESIQRANPNFIAPLRFERMQFMNKARNPALAQIDMSVFIARHAGRDVGRITAHIDRAYDAYHRVRAGWFGFFESIDEPKVAHALLDAAVRWARSQGAQDIIGPSNFTTSHQVGLLVENFERPAFVETTYNPKYYENLIASYGFGKAKDLLTWFIDVTKGVDDPKLRRYFEVSEKVKRRYGLRVRSARMDDFRAEVARLFELYNGSWQENWGFVPISAREFKSLADQLKSIIDPSLVLVVEDRTGTPVAFSICLPNVNEVMPKNGRLLPFGFWKLLTGMKKVKHARLFALGVLPGYRQRGVEGILSIETALRAKKRGILGGEIGWTLEDNSAINRTIESFGGRLDRRHRLFGIDLT